MEINSRSNKWGKSSSSEFIKDEANDLLQELQCPPDYIAGILKSIADDFVIKEKKDA